MAGYIDMGTGNVLKLIYMLNPPCSKCPYTLGLIHAIKNPCPQCRDSGYALYKRFSKKILNVDDQYAVKNDVV